jgi:hypothetical protein
VLFSFLIVILLLCTMLVVDVGFYMRARQQAQGTADAAALAGAQELPDDPDLAEEIALDYIVRNGLDPDTVEIEFSCTSDTPVICEDGDGRYDTIRLTPHVQAPSFFGGVLTFMGIDSCWEEGCTAQASAAGCRGACGPVGTDPVDVVQILDRTGSMSSSDLANVKNAAKSILGFFDRDLHNVGLGVLGPSSTSSTCSGSYAGGLGISTSSGGTWLPVEMTNNYQNSDGSLNNSSTMVKTVNCLDTSSVGTNLGDPLKAAAEHLQDEGRPEATWGVILFTDGAANQAPTTTVTSTSAGDTGWNNCASNGAVTSSAGDNNGFQSNASGACSNGGSYAEDVNSGTNTNTSCSNTGKDKHRYWDFDLGSDIPNNAAIDGIEVRLDGWTTGSPSTRRMCVELSWNDGSSWTAAKTIDLTGSETSFFLGGATDNWGRTWDDNEFDGNNFRIRITNVSNVSTTDFRLDYVAAKVYYTSTSSVEVWDGHLGPCDYAMTQAENAKALGIEIYTIAYGLGVSDQCVDEDPASEWDGEPINDLLVAMATDADHFYDAPLGEDLEPIFYAIGGALTAGGSRLVE